MYMGAALSAAMEVLMQAQTMATGTPLDPVWEDPGTMDDPDAKAIRRNMYVQRPGYRMWTAIHIVLYLAMFFVPGVGGVLGLVGAISIMWVSLLALIGSACVAVVFFIRPETEAGRYQAGVQYNQAARVAYIHGDKEEAYCLLRHAIDLTTPPARSGPRI